MSGLSGKMGWMRLAAFAMALVAAFVFTVPAAMAGDAEDAQVVVDKAGITFKEFMRDPNYKWLQENLKKAKGILIYPQVLKAGFILGGSGGTGILSRRDEKSGRWSYPAFYSMGAVSFGLQAGGESAEVILLVMSQKGMDSLMTSKFNLGGDTSVAVGPVGGGAKSDITTDFISFTRSKGLYAGLNLEGSYIDVRDSLNKAYYGKDVSPADIMIRETVSNKRASAFRAELEKK